jgi:hypothetical protein
MKRTMKKLLLFLAAATMAVSCIINIGGGSAVWVGECTEEGIDHTEVREVGHFRAVASSLPANVYYVQADQQEVRVETTEELASKVQTTVEDGILSLKLEPGRYPKLILRVVVSSPDIEKLSVSGSGNLIQEGPLHASGSLALKVSGSGDIRTGEIDSQDFTAQCSGSGSIRVGALACDDFGGKISGSGTITMGRISCDDFEMGVSGSGDFLVDVHTSTGGASVRVSGSGNVRLKEATVDGNMDLKTSGSGDITVNGSCHDLTAAISGSGDISGNLKYDRISTHTSGSGSVNL